MAKNNFSDITADRRPAAGIKKGDSLPDKAKPGTIFEVKIIAENWEKVLKNEELYCGRFEISA